MLRILERLSIVVSLSASIVITCFVLFFFFFVSHAMPLTPGVVRDSHTPPTVRGMYMRIGLSLCNECYFFDMA